MKFLQNQRKKIIIISQFFFFYLIEFGILLNRHYSPDSYIYSSRYTEHYEGHLITARVVAYIVSSFFKSINITKHEIWFVLFLILTLAFSAGIIYMHYTQWVPDHKSTRNLLKLAIVLMYGNVYMVDFFHFPEAIPTMSCGIIFMTVAVLQIVPKMSVKRMLIMMLCMAASLNCYQVTLGFFVFFAIANIYIINKGKLTVTAFWESVKVLIGSALTGGLNVILLRLLQNTDVIDLESRTESVGIDGWILNAKQIVSDAYSLFVDTAGFLPRYSVLIVLLSLYVLVAITLWKQKSSWKDWLYIVLMVIACRSMVFVPHLLASAVWMAPRSIVSYWSIISIPCIVLVVLADKTNIKNIALIFMGGFCIINALSIQRIGLNILSNNRIDEEISYMIQTKIEDYESESGTEVKTIFFRNDAIPTYHYRSTDFGAYELSQRAYTVSWSCVEMINYFNGENYMYADMGDEA